MAEGREGIPVGIKASFSPGKLAEQAGELRQIGAQKPKSEGRNLITAEETTKGTENGLKAPIPEHLADRVRRAVDSGFTPETPFGADPDSVAAQARRELINPHEPVGMTSIPGRDGPEGEGGGQTEKKPMVVSDLEGMAADDIFGEDPEFIEARDRQLALVRAGEQGEVVFSGVGGLEESSAILSMLDQGRGVKSVKLEGFEEGKARYKVEFNEEQTRVIEEEDDKEKLRPDRYKVSFDKGEEPEEIERKIRQAIETALERGTQIEFNAYYDTDPNNDIQSIFFRILRETQGAEGSQVVGESELERGERYRVAIDVKGLPEGGDDETHDTHSSNSDEENSTAADEADQSADSEDRPNLQDTPQQSAEEQRPSPSSPATPASRATPSQTSRSQARVQSQDLEPAAGQSNQESAIGKVAREGLAAVARLEKAFREKYGDDEYGEHAVSIREVFRHTDSHNHVVVENPKEVVKQLQEGLFARKVDEKGLKLVTSLLDDYDEKRVKEAFFRRIQQVGKIDWDDWTIAWHENPSFKEWEFKQKNMAARTVISAARLFKAGGRRLSSAGWFKKRPRAGRLVVPAPTPEPVQTPADEWTRFRRAPAREPRIRAPEADNNEDGEGDEE